MNDNERLRTRATEHGAVVPGAQARMVLMDTKEVINKVLVDIIDLVLTSVIP